MKRSNLSHTAINDLKNIINCVKKKTNVPIYTDREEQNKNEILK